MFEGLMDDLIHTRFAIKEKDLSEKIIQQIRQANGLLKNEVFIEVRPEDYQRTFSELEAEGFKVAFYPSNKPVTKISWNIE